MRREAAAAEVVAPSMVLVPAGEFTMGDPAGRPDERPAHRVYVSAFELAVLPVTNRDFAAFLAATAHATPRFWDDARFNAPEQPVVGVSWQDASNYCAWLSNATGRDFRLPTEAEREKAMRGGDEGRAYPWGEADEGGGVFGDAAANLIDLSLPRAAAGVFPQDAPFAAGLSRQNGCGLIDIAYNVHEWCSDWYSADYYAVSPARDPQGPATGTRRASRGGAWRHQVKVCRNGARSSLPPDFQYNDYGFRVAGDLTPRHGASSTGPFPLGKRS